MIQRLFAIIVPCYNEELRIQKEKFLQYAKANPDYDILLVNDGSTDGTLKLLYQIAEESSGNVRVFDASPNGGKAEAIRKAMNFLSQFQYKYIGYIDADLSAPLSEINHLYYLISQKNLQIVAGARVNLAGKFIERSAIRHYLGRIFATYYGTLLKLENYDTQCGLKIFDAEIVRKIFAEPFVSNWFFDIELFLRARRVLGKEQYRLQVLEVPLEVWMEVKGSKLKITDFLRAPLEVFKIYIKYKKH